MMLQERPVCFHCNTTIESNDFVFEAPCGHREHASAVMHPLCLMEFRDRRPEFFEEFRRKLLAMAAEMMAYGAFDEDDDDRL